MQKLYKGYFMAGVKQLIKNGVIDLAKVLCDISYKDWKDCLYSKDWVVYTKKPFSGCKHVIDYLGRYSHRVAITNHRIVELNDTTVTYTYKDYRQEAKRKMMTLSIDEFVRRFCLHPPIRFAVPSLRCLLDIASAFGRDRSVIA